MRKIIPHGLPGEFKCRICEMMWSSFIQNNVPCITTSIRHGLHDFDFANPIRVEPK